MSKTVLFQTILFSHRTQFISIWPQDMTVSGATTPSQSGHGSDRNKGVIRIPQSSSITGASPSDCFVSYVICRTLFWGVLLLCRDAVGVFYSPNRLGQGVLDMTINNDGEVPVMLELWGMWSIPSLPLPGVPLWSGVVAPYYVLYMDQRELFDYLTMCKQMTDA